jgi:hypothetical protein
MATENQARKARDEHFDLLQQAGAHTLAVDIKKGTKKSYAIIAFVEENADRIPSAVEVKTGNKTTSVPVIVEKSKKFKPE